MSTEKHSTFEAMESGLNYPLNNEMGGQDYSPDLTQNPNPSPVSNPSFDDEQWSFYFQEHMEEVIMNKMDLMYNEAVSKLVSLGYNEEVSLNAILEHGWHCLGDKDAFGNIMNNSLLYLTRRPSGGSKSDGNLEKDKAKFTDLRNLEEHLLKSMVYILKILKPHLTISDAIWCLLMSDLQIARAIMMETPIDQNEDGKNQEVENVMLNNSQNMNHVEIMKLVFEYRKDEMMLSLIRQVMDLEKEVNDRKEWAHKKVLQAATMLSNDLAGELRTLRMEKEATQQLKEGKQNLEVLSVKKRLSELESELKEVNCQFDSASATFTRLDTENAEIRADIEATKLSTSETMSLCKEASKREKKFRKELVAWEKQKSRIHEEICTEKQKISEAHLLMVELETSKKDAEAKFRDEQKKKLLAASRVEEEKKLREAAKIEARRRHEALRMKIEIDFQHQKDDFRRLQEEYSRLKPSAEESNSSAQGESSARVHEEWENPCLDTIGRDRECIFCLKDEVSVLFLPCAHQVLCVNCHEEYEKKGRKICPCCRVLIQERFHIFV